MRRGELGAGASPNHAVVRHNHDVVPAKAGTLTPRPLVKALWQFPLLTTDIGGYGSLLSQGRRESYSAACCPPVGRVAGTVACGMSRGCDWSLRRTRCVVWLV